MDRKTEKILKRVCFECAKTATSHLGCGLARRGYPSPALGGKVDRNTTCKECPVADMRGDGAKISAGQPNPLFEKMLIATPDCAQSLTVLDTWYPCFQCSNTTDDGENVHIHDLQFCFNHCPVIEMREVLEEQDAEAHCS